MSVPVLVLDAHARADSLGAALARAYADGARAAGAAVRVISLRELRFDPNFTGTPDAPQALEPDLAEAQRAIAEAAHVAWVYPVWWGTYPALLKGFLDRALTSGFAFRYRDGGRRWDRLLAGRSARVLLTMDWPSLAYHLYLGAPAHKAMDRATLGFVGFAPVRITSVGPVVSSTPDDRARWLAEAGATAARDVRAAARRKG